MARSTRTSLGGLVNIGTSIESRSRVLLGVCLELWCNLDYFSEKRRMRVEVKVIF